MPSTLIVQALRSLPPGTTHSISFPVQLTQDTSSAGVRVICSLYSSKLQPVNVQPHTYMCTCEHKHLTHLCICKYMDSVVQYTFSAIDVRSRPSSVCKDSPHFERLLLLYCVHMLQFNGIQIFLVLFCSSLPPSFPRNILLFFQAYLSDAVRDSLIKIECVNLASIL